MWECHEFDTVPHEGLIGKLAHSSLQVNTKNWIRAFFTNRNMSVDMDGKLYTSAMVISGI